MSRKAFTLIELLVVVAIISLLVSILLPALSSASELARRAICGSNVRNMMTGFIMYANENEEWFPSGDSHEGGTNNYNFALGTTRWDTEGRVEKFYGFMALVRPAATQSGSNAPLTFDFYDPNILYCPSCPNYTYEKNFPKTTNAGGQASYTYRGVKYHDKLPARFITANFGTDVNKQSDPPSPMVMDRVEGARAVAHGERDNITRQGGWYNVGVTDGSVVSFLDTTNVGDGGAKWIWNFNLWRRIDVATGYSRL